MSGASSVRVALAVLILAAVSLWWMLREPDRAARAPATAVVALVADPPTSIATAVAPPEREIAGDGIAVMAAGTGDHSADEPRHPHPITPVHERNFRQINMVAVLNGSMDTGDVEELRRANRQYRNEYPEAKLLQEGYDLIADCLDRRTPATRTAAERYWENEIASNLRRYVRRHCLD
jgi:hypothetical protein